MAERDLVVRFIGDDRDLNRALTSSTRGVTQFESRFTKLNQSLRGGLAGSGIGARGSLLFGSGAFIGTAAVTASISKSIQAASDLNEEISKNEQVFGSASAAVEDWSRTTAQSIGLAQQQALAATGTFGNLFNTVGLGPQAAAEMSQSLVTLAADLASFNNSDISDTLLAIRSGLIGEAEPLRRYGVLLSETRVQQVAMANTGKENVKALTDQEKALARYQIILRDTAPAQGDFARTSEGLANQSRILRANMNDLAATMGGGLLPIMLTLTDAANDLFAAFKALDGLDVTPGFEVPDPLGDFIESHGGNQASFVISPPLAIFGAIKDAIEGQDQELTDAADRLRSPDAIDAAINAAEERERAANAAKAKTTKSQKAFAEFVKGMGLKLDRAGLTASLDDDIAVLRELERAIERQIAKEGRTFELVEQLTSVRRAIADTVGRRAAEAAQESSDAYNAALDALGLELDIAGTTKSFADDQRLLREIEQVILKRIEEEGRTTELLRDLFENRQQQAEIQRQMAAQERARRQENQFEELGLTAEGEQRTPGAGALTRRARSLQDQIKGTVLDTSKTRSQLEAIIRVLSGAFGKAGKDVRQAILGMLNDISQALEGGGSGGLNVQTKFVKRGVGKLLEGLGLTAEQIKEIEQRFAQQGPGGTVPGQGTSAFGFALQPKTSTTTSERSDGRTNLEFHIYIDGEEVEARVTRRQQKKRGRGAASRRGPDPGVHR